MSEKVICAAVHCGHNKNNQCQIIPQISLDGKCLDFYSILCLTINSDKERSEIINKIRSYDPSEKVDIPPLKKELRELSEKMKEKDLSKLITTSESDKKRKP